LSVSRQEAGAGGVSAGRFDEAFGHAVDRAAFAAAWRVDVERAAIEHLPDRRRLRCGYSILHRQSVVSQQKFRSENAVEVEKQPRGSWRL